jgi:glycosyltransferase involved in cell wall biosynthesis
LKPVTAQPEADPPQRVALISEHASPLATLGGEDAGGQNIHVTALAGALADRGHQVVVYTRRDDPGLAERVELRPGVVVEHLDAGPASKIPKDELRPLVPAMTEDLLRRWSAGPAPTVAHAHFWMSGLAALPAAQRFGIPLLQTFHALGAVKRRMQGEHDGSPADRIRSERRLAMSVDRIIATCSDELAELRAMGAHDAEISVIPCGVDLSQFCPSGRVAPRGAKHRLLTVGRLVRRKGVDDIIEALADLPDTELVVVGGPSAAELDADDEVRRLRSRAATRGVASRITWTGGVDRDEVARLMRSADLVVCAPWYEPFGIVPLEAMACGTPVVATAVGGMLDTVCHGKTGRLVPPRQPEVLAATIRDLLENPALRAKMGRAGSERARSNFSWARVAELTAQEYALAQRSTERPSTDLLEASA